MKLAWTMALMVSILLAVFLILRPVFGRMGTHIPPDTEGMASNISSSDSLRAHVDTTGLRTTHPPVNTSGITEMQGVEGYILQMTNEARAAQSLPPLAPEPDLAMIARGHSTDMLARGYFDHNNPDRDGPADRVAQHHRRHIGLIGENLWMRKNTGGATPADSVLAADVMAAWMNSPGHRANILRPEYTHLGVGVSRFNNDIRATQLFAMTRAYLDQPVPVEIFQGSPLSLTSSPQPSSASGATDYDFWSPELGLTASPRLSVTQQPDSVAPGLYKLRFYFSNDTGGSTIYMGPRIMVK